MRRDPSPAIGPPRPGVPELELRREALRVGAEVGEVGEAEDLAKRVDEARVVAHVEEGLQRALGSHRSA
jgi:hypothetical protein